MTKISKRTAVSLMIARFEKVPTDWVQNISEKYGNDFRGVRSGAMYLVGYPDEAVRILQLTTPVIDPDDEMFGAMRVSNLDIYGWNIGKTETDANLILGINDNDWSDDRSEKIWESLYDLLAYDWHTRA